MYFPNPWWATSECNEDSNPDECEFLDKVPGDVNLCQPKSKCKNDAALVDWYTNYTSVAQRTISKVNIKKPDMISVGGTGRFGPWNSPGAAPIVGGRAVGFKEATQQDGLTAGSPNKES